jgi:hypothetical protein
MPDLTKIPFWYCVIAIAFGLYHAWRGGQANYIVTSNQKKDEIGILKNFSYTQIFFIYTLQDSLVHFLCTLSGFLSLYILNNCRTISSMQDSVAIVFLSLYSIAGITDLLPQLLPLGKFPGKG